MSKKIYRHQPRAGTLGIQKALKEAIAHDKAGRLEDAERIYKQLIKKDPNNLVALGMLGSTYRKLGKQQKALQLFEKALQVNPGFVPALGNLGDIYQSIGRYPEAIHCYEKIIQLAPDNIMAYFNLGMVFLVLTQFDDAITNYQKVLAINPNYAAAYTNIGNALLELGRIDEATASYNQALEIDPKNAHAHFNKHATVFNENDLSPSIASLESSLKAAQAADHNYHEARAYLGMLLDFTGDNKGAEAHFSFIQQNAASVYNKVDSWRYVSNHLKSGVRLFSISRDALEYSLSKAQLNGLVLEFGVRNGVSINLLAKHTDQEIHGFDSFDGLPDQWEGMPVGALSTYNQLPEVPDHVHLHVGWFEDTLPEFVENYHGPVRFMNVDCDIYSSTKTIFKYLSDRIIPGTVIIFDEYICNPAWRDNEFKAFQEFVAKTGLCYEYLLFSPFSKQAAVIVTKSGTNLI